jgi:integrase/recombinase XerC
MTELERILEQRERLSPLTKVAYRAALRDFLRSAGLDPRGWTPEAVLLWRQRMQATHLQPQTINKRLHAIRSVSHHRALLHHRPDLDFAAAIETIRVTEEAAKRHALTPEQARALVAVCRGTQPADLRDYAIAVVGLRTGMRRMSLCALDLQDVDWRRHTMTITLKGGKRHTMPPLDEAVFEALAPWRDWLVRRGQRQGRVFRGFGGALDGTETTPLHNAMSARGLHDAMGGRAKRAGLDGFSPHIFRHTFVTWMQDAGVPTYVIAAYTGHKSDAMILEYTDAWLQAQRVLPTSKLPSL